MSETTGIDFDVLALHVGIMKGYLLGQHAPEAVMDSFNFMKSQFIEVAEAERLNILIDRATPDKAGAYAPSSKKWTDDQRQQIWTQHQSGMTPKQIAKTYPGRNSKSVQNLIILMTAERK